MPLCPLQGYRIREEIQWKKKFSFGHCPNYLTPPPMTPIWATWSSFFGRQNSRFESQFRTKKYYIYYMIYCIYATYKTVKGSIPEHPSWQRDHCALLAMLLKLKAESLSTLSDSIWLISFISLYFYASINLSFPPDMAILFSPTITMHFWFIAFLLLMKHSVLVKIKASE